MELIIEIPDEQYEWIKSHKGVTAFQTTQMLYNRVREGVPLLYGHGRLIDGDSLTRNIEWLKETSWYKDEPNVDTYLTRRQAIEMVLDVCVKPELTVIEADRKEI